MRLASFRTTRKAWEEWRAAPGAPSPPTCQIAGVVYVPNAGAFTSGHGFEGGPDRYFRNNGRGRFKDKTQHHVPRVDDPTTDAAFGDIDGDPDLVVGNSGENGDERVFVQRRRGRR